MTGPSSGSLDTSLGLASTPSWSCTVHLDLHRRPMHPSGGPWPPASAYRTAAAAPTCRAPCRAGSGEEEPPPPRSTAVRTGGTGRFDELRDPRRRWELLFPFDELHRRSLLRLAIDAGSEISRFPVFAGSEQNSVNCKQYDSKKHIL